MQRFHGVLYSTNHIHFFRNQSSGTCANPAEPIKKACARSREPLWLVKYWITA